MNVHLLKGVGIASVIIAVTACTGVSSPGLPSSVAPSRVPTSSSTNQPSGMTVTRPNGITVIGWAPDGRHLLLDSGALEVVDADGRTVTSPTGAVATWIDPNRLATWTPAQAGSIDGSVVVAGLDGSTVPISGSYSGLGFAGDGAGDLTLMPVGGYGSSPADRFVTWSNARVGDFMPGWPLGWSRDGSTLIVATTSPIAGTAGSSRSVAIAVMIRPFVAKARPIASLWVDPDYVPVFDSTSTHVAFACAAVGDLGTCHQIVVDLTTDTVHDVGRQPPGLPLTWVRDGGLLLATRATSGPGTLFEWNGSAVVASELPSASWAVAASSGNVALVTEAADGSHTTRIITSNGAIAAEMAGIAEAWSADGSAVAIMADSGLQVTLVRVP